MTSPYEIFKTNEDLESGAGVVIEYPGFEVTIHRAGGSNTAYRNAYNAAMKPYARLHQKGLLDPQKHEEIVKKCFAKTVVKGWKGLKGKDGKALKFSVENCIKVFDDLPEFYADLAVQATQVSNFNADNEEAEAKN